jgi:hypothetical protein
MAKTPAQPVSPPKGTSPSKNIQRGNDIAWDSWNQHGNKTPAEALSNDKNTVRKPVPTGGKE